MPELEGQDPPGEDELEQDRLVDLLMPDPSQGHPNVRALVGFLGKSTQKDRWRLYLTPSLDVYVEIPREAIVQRYSLGGQQNPLGGTLLWVKQDADMVLHTRTNLLQRQAQFLGGNIYTTRSSQGMTSAEAAALRAVRESAALNAGTTILGVGCSVICCPNNPEPKPPDD